MSKQDFEDAVDRQASLNTIESMYKKCDGDLQTYHNLLVDCFEVLPNVQPKTECEDAVSREDALRICYEEDMDDTAKRIYAKLTCLQSVQPKVKTGHWIEMKRGYLETRRWESSECGKIIYAEKENFCPKCGKRMVDVND